MRRLISIIVFVMALLPCNDAIAQQLQWKEIPGRNNIADVQRQKETVEITGNNLTITIKTSHRISVRVFTILGQTVSVATLNPGTSELKVGSRGIYIVKIGNFTQKVAL